MTNEILDLFSDTDSSLLLTRQLVRRLELFPSLVKCYEEDRIVSLVDIESEWLENAKKDFLGDQCLEDVLASHHWSLDDLDSFLLRPEALMRFASYHFSPGLEETFLSSGGSHDQVIYSLMRVRDPAVAQELWIRLEEREATFAELASTFGEGPESSRKGLMGPIPFGSIFPKELGHLLRSLQPGEIHPPRNFGEWFILLRLEQLTPARFDSKMREFLLKKQLDKFLSLRINKILNNESVDELVYDSHQ